MKEKKNIFSFLTEVILIFGFTVLVLDIFCIFIGDSAKGYSAIFELGSQGIPVKIAFQFLGASFLIAGAKLVFLTDSIIKKMALWLRTVCMLTVVVAIVSVFSILFRWFPINMWQPWAMFFICFGLAYLGSILVMTLKEKMENRQLEEALQRLKEKEGD